MKKSAILTLAASLLIFTSCQDPIYEAIREDVKPEEATVSGNIGSITRYTAGETEFLVLAANDGLRYKQKDQSSHGQWKSFNIPFSLHSYDFDSSSHTGEQIVSVLANDTTLYLISAVYDQTGTEGLTYPTNIKLWGRNITADGNNFSSAGEWKLIVTNNDKIFPIGIDVNTNYYVTLFTAFQTNAPKTAHRAAFIHAYDDTAKTYRYYQLKGLEAPVEITIDPASIIDAEPSTDAGATPVARSAVYFNGGIKFFTSSASTTNETYDDEATFYYYTNKNNRLYYSKGDTPAFLECHSDYVISSLATTADSILIGYGSMISGVSGGIDRATLVAGVPTGIAGFTTNAQFQITRLYVVLALLNASPEKTEKDSNLYAAITFGGSTANFDNIGLWSYYPGRGNWNRE